MGDVGEGKSVSGIGASARYLVFISAIQNFYDEYKGSERFEKHGCV